MTAVILINLGTPNGPAVASVRSYLKEFLSDPFVIDIPFLLRWLLLNGVILRTRPARSAAAYRKIWTSRGSPLLFHTVDLAAGVASALGPRFLVKPAMRYGQPSIENVVTQLQSQQISRWIFVPLYPQYSYAATRTAEVEIRRVMERIPQAAPWEILRDFPMEEGYLAASAEAIREAKSAFNPDHILFSYHGIPDRHLGRADSELKAHCLSR